MQRDAVLEIKCYACNTITELRGTVSRQSQSLEEQQAIVGAMHNAIVNAGKGS